MIPAALSAPPRTRLMFSDSLVLLPPSLSRPLFLPAMAESIASYPAEAPTAQAAAAGPQAMLVNTTADFVAPVEI
jgi:hypothetical protein